MIVAMSDNIRRPTGRADDTHGISETVRGRFALRAGAATLTGLAAAAAGSDAGFGPGAVVLAGAGAVCTVALAQAVLMRTGAKAPAPQGATPLPGPAAPAPQPPGTVPPGGDPLLYEIVVGLAAQVARLDEKLDAAMAGGAAPEREGNDAPRGTVGESLATAVEHLKREQHAVRARIEAEAENAELRSKARIDALSEAILPRVESLNQDVARLGRAVAQGDARARDFEGQMFDIFRARDAGKLLRRLDAEASRLFDELVDGDERRYATADAWRADYAEWRSRINSFWDVLRGYRTSVEQPFAVSEADIDRAGGIPDNALFAAADMRFRYKMLVVVNDRHTSFKEDAFSFNEKKGSPPDASAPTPPQARLSSFAPG
jgi:hypothetical protein